MAIDAVAATMSWLYGAGVSLGDFVDHWQTLIAGLLALGGAWWTVHAIRAQVGQAREVEVDRRAREERAAKVVLSLALSELTQYAKYCLA
jgi:hypothetical protein